MSLNLEMLQVARLSSKLLGESADLVANFLRGLQNEDGGFADRAGKSARSRGPGGSNHS